MRVPHLQIAKREWWFFLYVDGALIASAIPDLIGTPAFGFGDGVVGTPTLSEWDYVTLEPHPVPEPSTEVLLIAGIAVMAIYCTKRRIRERNLTC
ncbi:MAG: PEP-CTERM sorting domain-containing protein [Bryobacteraceae bacterium]